MSMMRYWLVVAALAACGKHGSDTPKAGSATAGSSTAGSDTVVVKAEADPQPAGKPTVPWKLDASVVLGKLQGSWLVRGFGSSGSVTAWRLEHGELTVFDPSTKEEKKDKLELWSPCEAHLESGAGGTIVVDGDDIYLGLGDGGVKRGNTVIACMGSGTVYATPKGCATYYLHFGSVEVIPTRCSYPDGRFVTVEGGTDHRHSSLRFWGNDHLLLSDQLAESRLEKQPSWDAAKAAAAKAKPSRGPSPASKTAAPTADGVTLAQTEPTFPPPPPEDKPAVPWSDDHGAAIGKLQGAWIVKGFGRYGAVSAWNVDGAKVTVYDPKTHTETPDVLLFDSPCAVRLDSGDGGTLVIDGDTVYLGLGAGGMKLGDTLYACLSSGTVVATPSGCTTYHSEFDTWSKLDTTCKQDGQMFVAKTKDDESSARFANDHTLLSGQLAASKLAKQPDWAAAKAAADRAK